MNPDSLLRCRIYLRSLAEQIDLVLPSNNGGYGYQSAQIPLERLPTIAALVREYVECEAILAGLEPPAAETEQTAGQP